MSQTEQKFGYGGPIVIHGDGCAIRSDGIDHYAFNSEGFFFFAHNGESGANLLTADEITECLPAGKEFTISLVDETLPEDNLELAEEFVGALLRCSEELFYAPDREVSDFNQFHWFASMWC